MISVVIPAYNEEDNVGRVYERLSSVFAALPEDWELIFAVDPSTDRTEERILELRAHRSAREDAALLAPLRPARGHAGRAWRPRPATPSWSSTATCRTRRS